MWNFLNAKIQMSLSFPEPKLMSPGALPPDPIGELTALPRHPTLIGLKGAALRQEGDGRERRTSGSSGWQGRTSGGAEGEGGEKRGQRRGKGGE